MKNKNASIARLAVLAASALFISSGFVLAEDSKGMFLPGIKHHVTLTSAIAPNGDSNPYAVVVAPVSAGKIHQGDVLIDNFNSITNLQGTGTTIMDYNPSTKKMTQIAVLPRQLPKCPGGVGLGTAMTMLKSGWIIVGSTPSTDGTTRTKGDGGLIVLNADGDVVDVWTGPNINGPWGNVALIDNGTTATLFVSMAGFEVTGPEQRDSMTGRPPVITKAKVVRFDLKVPEGKLPTIDKQTVVADGFGQRADKDAFLVGPTGLALGKDGTLYVSDALGNQVVAIEDAVARTTSAGLGKNITKDGLLHRPLALTTTPGGHLLAINANNGQVVEIDPATGKQLCAQWIDADQAQSPPGNGDLFGIAINPAGNGFYYVEDDMNTLVEARP